MAIRSAGEQSKSHMTNVAVITCLSTGYGLAAISAGTVLLLPKLLTGSARLFSSSVS